MESAVNGLTNSAKILALTKRDAFQFYILQNDEKAEQRCSLPDFCSFWDPLTCLLPRNVLKVDQLCIYVSTFFGVKKFPNIKDMTLNLFFSKCSNFHVDSKNAINYKGKIFGF